MTFFSENYGLKSVFIRSANLFATPMEITLNGEPRNLRDGLTVADLLVELKLSGKPLAVEVNADVVPRAKHGGCILRSGDRVEIVTLVGGG